MAPWGVGHGACSEWGEERAFCLPTPTLALKERPPPGRPQGSLVVWGSAHFPGA